MVTETRTDAAPSPLTPERPPMATLVAQEQLDTVAVVARQGTERHDDDGDERALASTSSSSAAASLPSTSSTSCSSSSSLVTLVSSDGYALTVPRRVAEESGTVRALLSSRSECSLFWFECFYENAFRYFFLNFCDPFSNTHVEGTKKKKTANDSSSSSSSSPAPTTITIPLPNIRRRELVSIFKFCARQLRTADELSAILAREEREAAAAAAAAAAAGKKKKKKNNNNDKAAAVPPGAAPTAASLAAAVRASLASDATLWAKTGTFDGGAAAEGEKSSASFPSSFSSSSRALLGRTLAANYLDVAAALDACADAVAAGCRGRSPAEIRARFGIAPDLTRTEEEAIKVDCAWAFDCC